MTAYAHKKQIKKYFNRAAEQYDQHNDLQKKAGERLLALLKAHASSYPTFIDIGCGTGLITQILNKILPIQKLYAIDIANAFLPTAQKRGRDIQFYEWDFDELKQLNVLFAGVFSNMALHWSFDLKRTLGIIHSSLTPNGVLAFSLPLFGSLSEIQSICHVNPFFSADDIKEWLKMLNFTLLECKQEKLISSYPNLKQALYSIKNVGANFTVHKKKGLQINPHLKQILMNPNISHDKITLTYQMGYFIVKT